ncbi:MAG: hypothetical protein KatS3mg012_0389 [Gaiellaceae bacterium]|jgi:hypothetical protein|nr:MAG: hypothetical protein KatS3mg012_0389 [Gaiellaceae bacterium]
MAFVRRLLTWIVVTFGVAAFVRWWRARGASAPTPQMPAAPAAETEPEAGDPAEELRQKLAETRGEDAAPVASGDASIEERRAEVHAEGRAVVEAMRSTSSPDDA